MNQLLQNRYNELGMEEVKQLKHRLRDSPKALRLIELLETRRGRKINTVDAVDYLYEGESGTFEVLRNRFFKLRKQLISMMEQSTSPAGSAAGLSLLPLEEKLYRCRQLISENHFQLARTELRALITECKNLNVFEVLPDAISQLIYCNMALNVLRENEGLTNELAEASAVLHDFRVMQSLSRKVYLCAIARTPGDAAVLFQQLRRYAIRRSAFPRFRMLYHFTVFTYGNGMPMVTAKSAARHLTALKALMTEHPDMPCGYYEPNYTSLLQFYFKMGEGTTMFLRGDVQGCYRAFTEAWEIQERIPNLRIRKSESHFANKIAIEIATGRYREALKTAEDLIEFQKEQRQEEKRLKAYAEIATIYSYAWPSLKCPNPEFIANQLKSYVAILRKTDSPLIGDALSTQAIFSFFCGDFKKAAKLISMEEAARVFRVMGMEIYCQIFRLNLSSTPAEIGAVKKELEKKLHAAISSDTVFGLRRAANMIRLLEESIKKQ